MGSKRRLRELKGLEFNRKITALTDKSIKFKMEFKDITAVSPEDEMTIIINLQNFEPSATEDNEPVVYEMNLRAQADPNALK